MAAALLSQGRQAYELFRILNPITHSAGPEEVARYKVEPYVVAGDIYSRPPHVGRGGWTWYTGSAGWLYRVGLESILGFRKSGEELTIDPCIPPEWPRFELTYHFGTATYRIVIENPGHMERGVAEISIDDVRSHEPRILLADDGRTHDVRVVMRSS